MGVAEIVEANPRELMLADERLPPPGKSAGLNRPAIFPRVDETRVCLPHTNTQQFFCLPQAVRAQLLDDVAL